MIVLNFCKVKTQSIQANNFNKFQTIEKIFEMFDFMKFSLDELSRIRRVLFFPKEKKTEIQKFKEAYSVFCDKNFYPHIYLLDNESDDYERIFNIVYYETDEFVREYCAKLKKKIENKIIIECEDIYRVIACDSTFIITFEEFNDDYNPEEYNYNDLYMSDLVIYVLLDSIGI